MTVRILSADEWPDAAFEGQPAVLPFVEPQNVALVVVEDQGRIVARLGVYSATYLEGLWVAPEYRHHAGVMRALLRQVIEIPKARGEHWAFGVCASEEMHGYLERLGRQVPVELFALSTEGRR